VAGKEGLEPSFSFPIMRILLRRQSQYKPVFDYKYRRKRKKGKPLLKVQSIPTKFMFLRRKFWSEYIFLIFLFRKGLERAKSAGTYVFKFLITNEKRSPE
jgi:hypothetical protein